MSEILLTGGQGFIGSNLSRELRTRGHVVWTCDLVHAPDSQHMRADVSHYRQIETVFERHKFDLVYHLAAEYGRWNGEDHYENLWKTNVIGTKNVLRLQQVYGFRLVFFSSAEVYGDHDGVMTEDVMERIPIKQMNDYAISKWAGELQCLNHAEMFGSEIVRVRPVGCYGPHEHFHPYRGVIPQFVHAALTNSPLTVHSGHLRIFDFVEDTCRTLGNLAEIFVPGKVYNIGGREEWAVTIEHLADLVLDLADASSDLKTVIGEEPFTTRAKLIDSSNARRDLGHDPKVDLREGLDRYIRWFRVTYGI